VKKHKVEIEVVLPAEASACDACIERLLQSLQGKPGLQGAHIDRTDEARPRLCLHYDPAALPLKEVDNLVKVAGGRLQSRFEHVSVPVTGLRHERQARLIEAAIARHPGVLHTTVGFGASRLHVEFDPQKTNRQAVLNAAAKAGLRTHGEASPAKPPAAKHDHDHDHGHGHGEKGAQHGEHDHDHGGPFGERSELVFSLACGALTGIGWGLGKLPVAPVPAVPLFVAAYLLGGWYTVKEAVVAISARKFEIDFLMLLAAVGAAALGEWFEGALLLFLFTLGHSLEGYAMGRARKAISALTKLVPETALRIDDSGHEQEVQLAELAVGDRVLVKPNTRLPADGFVSEGVGSVNQAPITGESVPVDKRPVRFSGAALAKPESIEAEHRVYAGSINGTSVLTVVVTKPASESTLARVVKMVAEAETQKSPTQQFTDRFERAFVPIILTVVGLLLFAWVVVDEPFARSFYRAMAVLVAASPCALAIATPSAVLAGVARAARAGVLVKGGAHLESLGLVQTIAFDKTGTLTEGKPRLTDVVPVDEKELDQLLRVSVALERRSDHPLASAIVEEGAKRLGSQANIPVANNVEAIVGFGIKGTVGDASVTIGKPGLFQKSRSLSDDVRQITEKLLNSGRTVMLVQSDKRFLGVLGVMDTPRESARDVVAKLHALGVRETIMLTGDNQQVADAVAKEVGISKARGDLLPEDKVLAIKELARGQGRVAMVGDGVNDAPAMANATVGIAMGAGGSDVALETADVALMADDLRTLPFAVGLSRQARRVIRQNLWASLGMVAFLVPATITGIAGMGAAVALHEGSTLLVVFNALRLLAYKQGEK
jgi:Cd2+/Zn2+-exporting ATPase